MVDSEELESIAIIGMSGRFPGANSVAQFWQNLVDGIDSISRCESDELEYSVLTPEAIARGAKSVSARGVLRDVDMFDAAFFGIYPKEAEVMDPQHRVFLECCWESLESAGYDSQAFPGMIGVYAGASLNTYLLNNLCGEGGFAVKMAGSYQISEYQTMMGNDKDFMPTRVSYKLNLRGPSMAIQTACSTSLVAISQACSSLLSYQCDMALSGGVSITFPQRRDYLYQEDGMASVDGTCRTFDADAKGTVFGHGCAVVLLKRLSDAIEDGDNILAVIKGTAINNDGSEKIGYAAPSIKAQAEVIAMAHAAADVSPESISYIEAHGTGTPLGDPIEIAALTQAFRDGGAEGNGYCAIGTGKPNISHLDVAAGATGLIKTVMQLQQGVIPPLLHFNSPNPKIDFASSPFYPVKEMTPWQRGDQPRRAGVSAFGVGGTNAHVVLEEAPLRSPRATSESCHVFPLSAKTETALATMRDNLYAKLEASTELDLADVAYTLQIGRKPFEYRHVVVASSRDELQAGLKTELKKSITGKASSSQPGVVFLFPGQGAQYVGMGRDLYHREDVFRREVDRCAEILQQHLGQDVRSVMYPSDETSRETAEKRINETSMTQPAIFVVEYALAKLWMSWGIQPTVVIGHSIGEYVCAVLAETFTLEEALSLLSVRARLMQALPGGSMLGVRLSAEEIEPMLPAGASIAAMNSPKLCTISGPTEVLEAFLAELESKNVTGRMLATSHAFHSPMMDPMLDEFTLASEQSMRCEPKLRWISSCTGHEMTAVDTADAGYWSRQLRQPVRFARALDTLLSESTDYVLLEVGPGRALNQFVRQHPASVPTGRVLVSMGQPENDDDHLPSTLATLGKLWAAGVMPDWLALHGDQPRYRVPLPTYPFERKRFWVDPPVVSDVAPLAPINAVTVETACEIAAEPAVASGAASVPQQSTRERIAAELRTILLNLSGTEIEDDDVTFMDLGFDSLFLSQASQAIESRFKEKITFRQLLSDLSTVGSIADYLEPKVPSDMFAPIEVLPPASTPIAAAMPINANSAVGTLSDPSDVQRMLAGHVHSIQQLLDQSQRQLAASSLAAGGNGLRVVRKPVGSAGGENQGGAEIKRFGPYKPIEKGEKGGLTSLQESSLNRLIDRYVKKTSKSKDYTAEHRPHFADPRAVSGFKSQWKEMVYPIVSARSKGSRIWDIDDNEYVDITMGFGTYFFGHSPDWLTDAISKQLKLGMEIGPQSPMAGTVAKMISEFTGLDRVTFCNTGSEAVMAAMRLARTVTGRNRIVYFTGDYHGMFEEVLVRGAWPRGEYRAQPIAPGIPASLAENILVLEYGTDESLEIIRQYGDEIAAVMVEPVQSRNPSFQPREFLHQVRAITKDIGAALIFDEVVTGFRCHPGGAQAYFGVKADMATYGKVVGGGIPIGVLAGSPKYMDALDGGMWQYGDDSFPEVGVTFFAGTFVRHPLAIAAAHAVLTYLKQAGPELQENVSKRVAQVCETINAHMVEAQVPIRMSSFSAVGAIDYAPDLKYGSLLWYYLRERNIHIWEGRPCYFTTAHTDKDLQQFIDAFKDSVAQMQKDGFLPERDASIATGSKSQQGMISGSSESSGSSASDRHRFPLAQGQREMWLGAQMSPDAAGPHHACNAFVLDGEFDLDALRKAVARVVDRHEGLRCTFNSDGTEVVVHSDITIDVPLVDLSQLPTQQQDARVQQVMEAESQRLFDLSSGPLIAMQVLKLSETKHQLVVTAQMIACDGWSHYVIFEELSEIYSAIREQREPVLKKVVPMRAYAQWQREYLGTAPAKACEDYWLGQFQTVPSPLELPTKGQRPLRRSVSAKRKDILLSAEFYDEIKRFGRTKKSSSFAVLLAAFQVWLHRLSGATDLVVGVPFSEQGSLGFDTLVGQCANTLPIRSKIESNESFPELLARTWDSLLDAQENTHYTFGQLIPHLDLPHDPSRIPLVSVIFNIDPAMTKVKFSGLEHRFFAAPRFYYQFDLGFNLVEEDGGLRVECDFNTNLFDQEIVQHWLSGYESLLRDIVADRGQTLALLPMSIESATTRFAGPTVIIDNTATVHGRIEQQVQSTPEAIAVRDDEGVVTYSELDRRANQLACEIQRQTQKPGARIGILCNRTSDMLVAVLATLKSGNAFVPLHPAAHVAHFAKVASDAGLAMILTHETLKPRFADLTCSLVTVQAQASAVSDEFGASHSPVTGNADDIACVMYPASGLETPQGSSSDEHAGETLPSGIEVSHRAIMNFLQSMQTEPGLSQKDVILGLSPLTSHASLLELVLPLTLGAQCAIVSDEVAQNVYRLQTTIAEGGITVLQATPTILRRMLSSGWQGSPELKIFVGGEQVTEELANRLHAQCRELWHLYGRPETSGWWSAKRLMPDSVVTLGTPVQNTSMQVVDDHDQPVLPGVPGELLIGSLSLTQSTPNTLLRTGERVRRLADGELQLLGGRDSFALIHGHDANFGDIESKLREHAEVNDAAVVFCDDLGDASGMVAYVFVSGDTLASVDHQKLIMRELRHAIRSTMPAYMLPSRFVLLSTVPVTLDGRLDRSALPAPPEMSDDEGDDYMPPSTPTQEVLVEIWQDVLNVPKVGITDHFFYLGGQSLMAVQVFARIEDELGRKLPLATLFEAPTIEQLSSILDDSTRNGKNGWPSLITIQSQGLRKALFLVHGAGGNVLLYQAMAEHLAPDYPLYGLQSQGLDGTSDPLLTIEAMAERYLKEVRAVQPHGPYYLGGYCLGGTVAYEMAQQLQKEGEEVALVAMLDTYNFSRALKSSMVSFLVQKIRFHLGNFAGLRPRDMLEYLREKYRVARSGEFANLFTSRPGFDVDPDAGRATSGAELNVQTINDNAAEVYIPKPYAGELTLFKPRINYKFYPDPKMGWGDLAVGGLKIMEFPFNPHAMLMEPYVQQLVTALKQCMNPQSKSTGGWSSDADEDLSRHESFELVQQ